MTTSRAILSPTASARAAFIPSMEDVESAIDVTPLPLAPPPVTPDMRGVGSGATWQERNAFLEAACERVGLKLPTTIRPVGDALIDVGQANLRRLRSNIDAMSTVTDVAAVLRRVELTEAAQDVTTPLAALTMTDAGALTRGAGTLGMTHKAMGQLCSALDAPRGAAGVLASLPPVLRAPPYNHWLSNAANVNGPSVLRTYKPQGGPRVVRAVASESYAEVLDSTLLQAVMASDLPPDARCEMTREASATHVEIIFPMTRREIRVGDVVLARIKITNSHDKSSAVHVDGGLLRVLCYNLTTAYTEDADALAFRHVGDASSMARRLRMGIRAKLEQILPFVVAFGDAATDVFPAGLRNRADVLATLEKAKAAPAHVLAAAKDAWDLDGALSHGDTRGGLANALTRASQGLTYAEAAPVEALAGRIIQQGWSVLRA